jgi:hypothetical protein
VKKGSKAGRFDMTTDEKTDEIKRGATTASLYKGKAEPSEMTEIKD